MEIYSLILEIINLYILTFTAGNLLIYSYSLSFLNKIRKERLVSE